MRPTWLLATPEIAADAARLAVENPWTDEVVSVLDMAGSDFALVCEAEGVLADCLVAGCSSTLQRRGSMRCQETTVQVRVKARQDRALSRHGEDNDVEENGNTVHLDLE